LSKKENISNKKVV